MFKAALTSGWKEGQSEGGYLRISTEEWDAEAVAMVMNIIHGCHQEVSQGVDLPILTKIAAIVNYYDAHEPFHRVSRQWLLFLRNDIPESPGEKLAQYMNIASVFEDQFLVWKTTHIAIMKLPGPMEMPPVLIPAAVIGKP